MFKHIAILVPVVTKNCKQTRKNKNWQNVENKNKVRKHNNGYKPYPSGWQRLIHKPSLVLFPLLFFHYKFYKDIYQFLF